MKTGHRGERGDGGKLGGGVPLRVGLVAATLVLVGLGLLASGVAFTSVMRHTEIQRIDQTLLEASGGWARAPMNALTITPDPSPAYPPSTFYVRGTDADGSVRLAVKSGATDPALPANNDVGPNPVTVGSDDASEIEWRAVTVHGPHGTLTTVAIDLTEVESTMRALIWSQFAIGAAVLLVLGVVGYAVVRRSLRPLAEVEQTAAAIAAG